MREALARSHHDVVVYDRPASRGRKPAAKRKATAARRPRRLGRLLFGLCALGLAGGVVGNALLLQTGQHPSPLFAAPGAAPASPARVPEPAKAAPRDARAAPAQQTQPASLAPLAAEAPAPAPAAPVRAKDAIGDLIRGGGAPKAPAPTVEAARPPVSGTVASGQRALSKLGYGPLKADGVAGQGTRAALERFEKDKGLAVTGEFGPRTVKALAAASGLAID